MSRVARLLSGGMVNTRAGVGPAGHIIFRHDRRNNSATLRSTAGTTTCGHPIAIGDKSPYIATHINGPSDVAMKTTLDISDPLLREARKVAARQGTTLRALVELGLRRILAE